MVHLKGRSSRSSPGQSSHADNVDYDMHLVALPALQAVSPLARRNRLRRRCPRRGVGARRGRGGHAHELARVGRQHVGPPGAPWAISAACLRTSPAHGRAHLPTHPQTCSMAGSRALLVLCREVDLAVMVAAPLLASSHSQRVACRQTYGEHWPGGASLHPSGITFRRSPAVRCATRR